MLGLLSLPGHGPRFALSLIAHLAAAAGLLAGCTVGPPHLPPQPDSGNGQQTLAAPTLDPLPAATPAMSAPVSGTAPAGATSVVVSGGLNAVPVAVLPGGRFCADVLLNGNASNALSVEALGMGLTSPAATESISQDPSAPPPSELTCNNEVVRDGGVSCSDPVAAVCAQACNGCAGDAWAPNDSPQQAPTLGPGPSTYPLQLCPCQEEWFSLVIPGGGLLDATVSTPPGVQVQLELHNWYGSDAGSEALASSNGSGELRWACATTGLYELRIFGLPDGGASFTLGLNDFIQLGDAGAPPDAGARDGGLTDGGSDAGNDAGPAVYGPCNASSGPGADPADCNPLTPYCDVNRNPPACVSGATDTVGESCQNDADCNLGLSFTQTICDNANTCAVGFCHSDGDCPASTPTCGSGFTCM